MYNLIQKLNDKFYKLEEILTKFDSAIANQVLINIVDEGENGREYGEAWVIDEDGINDLLKIYKELEDVLKNN